MKRNKSIIDALVVSLIVALLAFTPIAFAQQTAALADPIPIPLPEIKHAGRLIKELNYFTGRKSGPFTLPSKPLLKQQPLQIWRLPVPCENLYPHTFVPLFSESQICSNAKWKTLINCNKELLLHTSQLETWPIRLTKKNTSLTGKSYLKQSLWNFFPFRIAIRQIYEDSDPEKSPIDFEPFVSVRALRNQPFEHHVLMSVQSNQIHLEFSHAPLWDSSGTFAFDGKRLLYLNGSVRYKSVVQLLREESLDLSTIKADALAQFFKESLLDSKRSTHWIVSSQDDIKDRKKDHYKVNNDELKMCSEYLVPPTVSGNSKIGWKVNFTTVSGFLHFKYRVSAMVVTVSPQYEVTVGERLLSTKIFSRVPDLRY